MPTSPDTASTNGGNQREFAARRMLRYLDRLPLDTEARLELALDVLRSLPEDTTPEQALKALRHRLPEVEPDMFPPAHPSLRRGHMPGQDLDRRHIGVHPLITRWFWLLFPALLLLLTLVLNHIR